MLGVRGFIVRQPCWSGAVIAIGLKIRVQPSVSMIERTTLEFFLEPRSNRFCMRGKRSSPAPGTGAAEFRDEGYVPATATVQDLLSGF
jgi:hypothetical protein